jgi:hypothetical protein
MDPGAVEGCPGVGVEAAAEQGCLESLAEDRVLEG